MGKQILISAVLAMVAGVSAFGQGAVVFANSAGTAVRYDVGPLIPNGSTFSADLMYAPDGTVPDLFDQVAIRVGAPTTFNGPGGGLFAGGGRTVSSITPAGGFGLFQVRVWETAYGDNYEIALINSINQGRYPRVGKSNIMRVDTDDPADFDPPTPLANYLSPIVVSTPEPSLIALAAVGAAGLLVFRRKRRR